MRKILTKLLIILLSLNLIFTSTYAYQADEEGNPIEEPAAEEAVTEPADVSQEPADDPLPTPAPEESPAPASTTEPILTDQEQFDAMMEQAAVQAELISQQERAEAYARQQEEALSQDLAQGAVGGIDDFFDKSEETLRKTGESMSDLSASAYEQLLARNQEEAEQKRLMEELGIAEQTARRTEQQYKQDLQKAIDAPIEERVARMREAMGLPEGTLDDTAVKNTFQQAAKDIGINVTMDGDLDNFTVTLSDEEVKDLDEFMDNTMAVGRDLLTFGYFAAGEKMAELRNDNERLKQMEANMDPENPQWQLEYDQLKEKIQKAADDIKMDLAVNSAFNLVGSSVVKAGGKAIAKGVGAVLKRGGEEVAEQAAKEGFWKSVREFAEDETGSFNLRNIFVRGSNKVHVTEDGTTILSDATFKRAVSNRLKATEEDVIGKPLGSGSYGIVFRKDDEATKIFSPSEDIASQEVNQRQVDLLKKAEGKYGLPEFLGEVRNSKGELIGVKQEYIEGKSLQDFIQGQDETPQKISLEAARKFIDDLMEAHTNLGAPHVDLKDGAHILMPKGGDPANPVFRMIDYGGVDIENHWLLRGSTIEQNMYNDVKDAVGLFFRTNTVRLRSPVKTIVSITDDEAERVANEILATAKKKYLSSKGEVKGIIANVDGADTNKDLPVASFQDIRVYELSVKKELIKDALRKNGSIDSEYVKDVLLTEIIKPEVREMNGGYEFVTGKAGTVEGEITEGVYAVDVDALPDSDISVPKTVTVAKGANAVIPIKVKQGSGKVEKDQDAITTNKVSIAIVSENNQVLPWAGLSITLTKVVQGKDISLNNGWNLVTLAALPAQAMTASTLIAEISKQGGYAITVSSLDNGFWKSYVVRGDKTYSGEDFGIEPGKAYFVKSEKKSTFTFAGQNFVAPVKLKLASGWNAVGLPFTSKAYKAADLPSEMAARWESGLWDTFVKKAQEEFGENFVIAKNRGYLVRLEKEGEFSP